MSKRNLNHDLEIHKLLRCLEDIETSVVDDLLYDTITLQNEDLYSSIMINYFNKRPETELENTLLKRGAMSYEDAKRQLFCAMLETVRCSPILKAKRYDKARS